MMRHLKNSPIILEVGRVITTCLVGIALPTAFFMLIIVTGSFWFTWAVLHVLWLITP